MESSFNDLGVAPPILKALEEMGFERPTEVQEKAIPHILNKEDLIVRSKTGSGKTAVFGVSLLQLTDPETPGPQGLILTPTRELAVQVDSDLRQMAKHMKHRTAVVYGQHSMNTEIQALKAGISIVTGTPGRVFDHISHGNLVTRNIRFLVLDEADRMLDMGFIDQVERIIRTIPKDRITLLFSATIPDEISKICRDYMKHPAMVEIESQTKTVDTINQLYYRVERNEKRTQLNRLLLVEQPESCLIFCNTRMGVDQVQNFLSRKGYASQALHGDIPQSKRLKTIQQFKNGEFHLLVATDVAARGIHIDDLSLVINYDVPVEKDSYIHRIGRTGRAGNDGRAITLVTSDDIMSLYEIEEHIGAMIDEAELPSEKVFNERKAGAEKWLQANTLKIQLQQAASGSDTDRGQNRRSHTGPQQNRGDRPRRNTEPSNNRGRYENRSAETRPGQKSAEEKPDYNAAAARHDRGNSGARPGNRPAGAKPDYRSETRPEYKNGARPEYRSGTRPEHKPGSKPEYKNGTRPEYKPGTRPEYKPGTRPDFKPGTRPGYNAGTRPEKQPSRPSAAVAASMKQNGDAPANREAKAAQPFLKRILGRIFGR